MLISRETDYAIRCVLYLAESYDHIVKVNEIAAERAIPGTFLSKILQTRKGQYCSITQRTEGRVSTFKKAKGYKSS